MGLRTRLASELATAALAHGDGDGGARTLVRRRAACVRVHGSSRAGLQVAGLLSAAGIGLVVSTGQVPEPGTVITPAESTCPDLPTPEPGAGSSLGPVTAGSTPGPATAGPTPGPAGAGPTPGPAGAGPTPGPAGAGPPPGPAGANPGPDKATAGPGLGPVMTVMPGPSNPGSPGARRRAMAGARPRRRPDLVNQIDSHRRELPAALVRDRVPHLAAHAIEAIGVVGPLVVPGFSACLRCCDLTRAERDPAWPLILAQLPGHPAGPLGCDSVLATAVTAQATAQALAFIDRGFQAVAATNGTLELVLPDWQWRRRTWQAHPRCDCGTYRSR
jgi:hypothetical protein